MRARSRTCPQITCSAETLRLLAITPIADRKRPTNTCILEIDAWPQQLQDKAPTRSKIMKIETSSIMKVGYNSSFFVFKAIFYHNKQMPKQQFEYSLLQWRKKILNIGWGTKLDIDRFIGGMRGGTMHFKIIGGCCSLLPTSPPFYACVLLVVSADKCHIHMCTIFFYVYVDHS